MSWAGPLVKPSKLDRELAKHARRQAQASHRKADARRQAAAWNKLADRVFTRDKGRCRATGAVLKRHASHPLEQAQIHHVVFRSAGGGDETSNLVTLSPLAHRAVHEHRLDITGNGDGTVMCRERDLETGRIVRVWDSPVP